MSGDRITRVCCEGSGSHHTDPRGEPYHDDTSVMLAKTAQGALIKVRVDMVSDRPHITCAHQLQGTLGAYESARATADTHRIWLRSQDADDIVWTDLSELEDEHLPPLWQAPADGVRDSGHGGSDYHVISDFIKLVNGESPWCRLGIHEAMDLTLPGLVSQESIDRAGEWLEVPDSRSW